MNQKYVLKTAAWYFFFTPNHPQDPEQYLKKSLLDLGHVRVSMHLMQDASQLWLVADAQAYALGCVEEQIKKLQPIVRDSLQLPDLESPLICVEACVIVDCEREKALVIRIFDPEFISVDMLPQNYAWKRLFPAEGGAVRFIGDVTLTEIRSGEIVRVAEAVAGCIDRYKTTHKLELVMFGITGYDQDPRALFDIPDVRDWAKILHTKIPFILDLVEPITCHWLLPCIADIEVTSRVAQNTAWRFRDDTSKKFIEETFSARSKLLNNLATSQEEFDRLAEEAFERFKLAVDGTSPVVKTYDQIRTTRNKPK